MRRIKAFILIGAGLLIYALFSDYSGISVFLPIIIWTVVIGCVGRGIWVLATPSREAVEVEEFNQYIEELKTNGEKVKVDFTQCEIKTNDYIEEREIGIPREQMWNTMTGDADKNVERVNVRQSVIVFTHQHNGQPETFRSGIISKERETLLFHLYNKKETILYINRNNREQYYFDLEFLFK